MIIHSQSAEVQTQVRGRYRSDLKTLYVYDNKSVNVPEKYIGKKLFNDDKKEVCSELSIRDKKSRIVGWTTVKKKLTENGYPVREGRENDRRYAIITRAELF